MDKNIKLKKKRKKVIDVLIIIVIIICAFNIVNSLYHIFMWKKDGDDIVKQLDEIIKIADVSLISDDKTITKNNINDKNDGFDVIGDENAGESDPYWAYVNMDMIAVDFYDLKEVNKDVAGWIQVNGTNINYPYVQTDNNKYYLTHAFDKSYNSAGWVFLDYRNNTDLSNRNNIIYAHGRYDKTMFGSLRNALTNGWLKNKDNYVIKIATPNGSSLWQVFSIYHIPETSDYLQINFSNDEQFLKFANKLIKRSAHKFDTKVSASDKILTLSTCYNDKERVVIHAKLIKREKKK